MISIQLLITIWSFSFLGSISDSIPKPLQERWFWNQTDLPRRAATRIEDAKLVRLEDFRHHGPWPYGIPSPINGPVSGIYNPFSNTEDLFSRPFSLEFVTLNHVNQPVGFSWVFGSTAGENLSLGIWNREITVEIGGVETAVKGVVVPFWKQRWTHFVLSFDGRRMQLFTNGKASGELKVDFQLSKAWLISYLTSEPYMQLHDLVKQFAVYDNALSPSDVEGRFTIIQNQIEKGILFPDRFHWMAGPYLHFFSEKEAALSLQVNESYKGELRYGEKIPLDKKIEISGKAQEVNSVALADLKPGTTYFYELALADQSGKDSLKTALLSFQTAKPKGEPFMFGVISDTESRPQINHRVSEMLWDERPDFAIHLGDLTDGGNRGNAFEWNMEYFQGIGPFAARVPILAVPGNGDADLHWFGQYHPQAGKQAYYRCDYGDASFWMLNSNLKKELQNGGEQYAWLESELTNSNAKWKFVVLHHAPYSSDEDDYGDTWQGPGSQGDPRLRDLVGLVEEKRVDAVFFGHLHTYMRTHPLKGGEVDLQNGVVYLQVGGTGGNLEDNAPTRTWFAAKNYRGFHYGTAQIVGDSFEWRTYTLEGNLIDIFQMTKNE
jgi:acid phosphatase type 7